MITIERNKDHFLVLIRNSNTFNSDVAAVRRIPAGKFNVKKQAWKFPHRVGNHVLGLIVTHKAQLADHQAPQTIGAPIVMPNLSHDVPVNATLRHYQGQGVERGIELERFMNGDEQGLGKTLQSIATLVTLAKYGHDVWPCIIVVPATIKLNWKREWEKWSGEKAVILSDRVKTSWPQFYKIGMANVFITNYESLSKYFVLRVPKKPKGQKLLSSEIIMRPEIKLFKSFILDESQRCKNTSTLQSKLCLRLAQGKRYRILCTGTPVINMPHDLYPQLSIMGRLKDFYPYGESMAAFKKRYCEDGGSNLEELRYKLNSACFFRREKKAVAKDLPDKERQRMVAEITNRKEYDRAHKTFRDWLVNQGYSRGEIAQKMRGEILVQMNALRKLTAMGKIEAVKDYIRTVINSGEKLIVFAWLTDVVNALKEEFPDAVCITGQENDKQKNASIDSFQNDPNTLLAICNYKSAGVGVTLTASSRVAFAELPWTYADCIQCEDRAHRIGQTNNVMCTYFLGENSIDIFMYELILQKKTVGNAITGATDQMQMKTVDELALKMIS